MQLLRVLLQVLHTAAEHTAAGVLHTAAGELQVQVLQELLRERVRVLQVLRERML